MKIAYVRVSTTDMNEQRQVEYLKKHNIEKWYIEKISAKSKDRPKLIEMLGFARESDIIYIHDLSRIARNTKDLLEIIESLSSKNISLVSNKENIDSSTATGKLMLTMIGAINQFERENLLERQREGIAIAKSNGVYKGRKPISIKDFHIFYKSYINREINKTELASMLNISRPTLNKLIDEHLSKQKILRDF